MKSMSIWKLTKEAEEDAKQLYGFIRQPPFLASTRRTCTLIYRLTESGEPAAIPSVASGLFSPDEAIHNAASSGIAKLLTLVPSLELIRLNELLGGSYYGYVSERWNRINPNQVESYLKETNDVGVGNLLSFHKSGYVRQAAISFLSGVESGEELRFLLVRQNDWVGTISTQAQSMVRNKMTDRYLKHFVGETNLLFHLLQCKRRDLSKTVSMYIDLLTESQHRHLLKDAFKPSCKWSSRKFVEYLLCRKGDHLAETVRSGVVSDDVVIRCMCLRHASEILPNDECVEVANKLLLDKFAPVRQEAYELKARSTPAESNNIWKHGLLDTSRSLRETAMFYLRKSGIDVAFIYREHLAGFPNCLTALSGLVSSGSQTDIELFSQYLDSPFASRRAEAIRGIDRVGSQTRVLGLQRFLLDESARVVRATHEQLLTVGKAIEPEFLFGLVGECKTQIAKNSILHLLLKSGKWSAMSYLIRAAASPDGTLAEL